MRRRRGARAAAVLLVVQSLIVSFCVNKFIAREQIIY